MKLSEGKQASDSSRRRNQEAVRSQASIGQVGNKKARSCPKSSKHRTGREQKCTKLSEGNQASDSSVRKKHEVVRSQASIGQVGEKKPRSFLKASEYRANYYTVSSYKIK
jgi:hypothetical protein